MLTAIYSAFHRRMVDVRTKYLDGVMQIECADLPTDGAGAHARFTSKR